MRGQLLVQIGRTFGQVLCLSKYFAFYIEPLSFNLQLRSFIIHSLDNKTTLLNVLLDFVLSNLQMLDIILCAELTKVSDRLAKFGLHLKHIQ